MESRAFAKGSGVMPAQDVRHEQADDHAEVDGGNRVEPFAADAMSTTITPRASKISPPTFACRYICKSEFFH